MIKVFKKIKLQQLFMILLVIIIVGTVYLNSNQSKAYSSVPYLIKVNRQMNCVTVYKKDKKGEYTVPFKAMPCSTGGSNTLLGTYKTPEKFRWKLLDGEVWGQYSTRVVGGILFHSVWYYAKDPSTLSAVQYNKLGTTASHGCIRLSVKDAKWIYDNCPLGTTVIIYDSPNPGPLGKPEAMKIPTTSGWDPTDPLTNNPWAQKQPIINGVKNKTVKYGDKVNLLNGVTAVSSTGFNITKLIEVNGEVNTQKSGTYKVIYTVTEYSGKTVSKVVNYKVEVDNRVPSLSGIKDQTVNANVVINRSFALKGVAAKFDGSTLSDSKIKVTITKNSSTKYTITYTIVASNGAKATKKAIITVDNIAPVIKGAKDKVISVDTEVTKTYALKGITATDNGKAISKSRIKVTISYKDDYYQVTYKVSDTAGNTTKKTVKYTVVDGAVIFGVKDKKVSSDVVVDKDYVMKGVTGYIDDVDATSNIQVSISELVNNQYTITYTLTDNDGNVTTVTATITVIPTVTITGAKDREITKATVLTTDIAMEGVSAKDGDLDVTDDIEVTISDCVDNKYTVTYSVVDSNGYTVQKTVIFTIVE